MGSLLLAGDVLVRSCSLGASSLACSPSPRAVAAPCVAVYYAVAPPSSACLRWIPVRVRSPSVKPEHLVAAGRGSALLTNNSALSNNVVYTVGDFMTKREDLLAVKPTTTIDEGLQMLVENRISGFPVVDDDWKLVGVLSDYDLLALDSISGGRRNDTDLFPEVDSNWKTFHEIQKLLSKTNGKVIEDLMTPSPLVVRETTNLEDAARLLLETKHRRLPVVDGTGKLVGIITRESVVRAALHIKRETAKRDSS